MVDTQFIFQFGNLSRIGIPAVPEGTQDNGILFPLLRRDVAGIRSS